jgi:hypothetical protein
VALVLAGFGVEHDDAVIAVAVGDVELVGVLVHERLGREPEVGNVVAAFARRRLPDLHQEFSVPGELQHHVVVERRAGLALAFVLLTVLSGDRGGGAATAACRRRAPTVAADPDVASIVHGDAVVRVRPVIAGPRSAPVADQVSGGIELEDRRRRRAALGGGRIGRRVDLARLERTGAVDDPHVVLRVHRDADRLAENPLVRQRPGPERIDFETRRLRARGLHRSPIREPRADTERDDADEQHAPSPQVTVH